MSRLAIIGGGSWGTALSVVLAPNFPEVRMSVHDRDLADAISMERENRRYLPGIKLPPNVQITADPLQAIENASVICFAVPSAYLRSAASSLRGQTSDSLLVSTTKGLEPGTLLCMSQVVAEAAEVSIDRIVALSGPSFAIETAQGMPTAVVVAGAPDAGRSIQRAFARPSFRVYSSEDRMGVELGGALKNVVAIGAGIASGLGLGHNAIAALITRGLAEITRLAVAMGAQPRTLSGLAGLGDLVLTCTGELSRNRRLGIALGGSPSIGNVLAHSRGTTEGVRTAAVAVELGGRFNVSMPIAEEMRAVIEAERSPAEAIRRLMDRSLREE